MAQQTSNLAVDWRLIRERWIEHKPEEWKPVEFDNYSRSKPKTEWIDPNKGYLADETYNAE